MPANEPDTKVFFEFLEAGERVLYTGHGHTGSMLRLSLSILWPILSAIFGKKDPLKQWRVAITDHRVLLVRRDSKEEQSLRFDQLSRIELKRSGLNRTLILRSSETEEVELGLPTARNDYGALEQALRDAAPQLMA
ncbi:MAG: hypothetical protein IH865_13300 [Chloroflexi bacterium]|nr:hypothetical protein [Chloroflexota bacterium]